MDTELRVLIVDDNPVERKLLAGLLGKVRPWQITTTTCATGLEAVTCVHGQLPDVAFVDFRLQGELGTDLIRKLKASGCRSGMVLFTGQAGETALLEALRAGADDYLSKDDLSIDSVSRVIHNTLAKVKTTRALDHALQELSEARDSLEVRVRERTMELQGEREKLKTITSTAHDPIIMIDHEARITFWNPAAERIFGYSEEEIMGREVFCLLPSSTFKRGLINTFTHFKETGTGALVGKVSEFTVKKKDGKCLTVAASIARFQDQEGWNAVVIPRDITQYRRNESILRRAKEEAERSTRLKDQFVSLVAHDLRGPFTTILGFLELMEKDKDNPLSDKQKGFVRWVVDSCQKMLRMIDELLNISRLKTGKITLEPGFINVRFMGDKVFANLGPLAAKKGITLINQVGETKRIYADPNLLVEVVQNLVSNAIKFSSSGDTITLFSPENQPTALAVKDTGVGISREQMKNLFKLEEKTSTLGTAGESGTGFGLPFSMDIVKAHGGSLTVESTLGEGSVFYVTLPEVVPRILVVDDDPDSRALFRHYLNKEGVTLELCDNGPEGLAMLNAHRYHLVICDIQMPGMNGFEFLAKMHADPKLKSIPAILITSDESMATRQRAFQMGAYDFITKPMASQDLVPRLRRFLGV
ncbi:MAG: response regulator [Magnetococcales bacterium]|nr:response regulator [Magnetococcales bacterium]MBF0148861.1 response regulator [Magnetococcales bacterium]MBF0173139.1 response regulator [Magnetococcales bacterium]MBF0346358.1 response regulator [Magnetococcales bacterium]MBF0629804.1 response regulator [Magnetococcales bacterium]